MTSPVRITAVIVTYNHEDEIEACVDAALAQTTRDLAVDVVVVDNASADGTRARLARYDDGVTVIANRHNAGFAEGVNAGVAAADDGNDIVLLNPDAVMDLGCVATLQAHFDGRPSCGAAAAFLRSTDGSIQEFARRDPGVVDVALTQTYIGVHLDERLGGRAARRRRYADEWQKGISEPVEVDCPAAACVLVRRELLQPYAMDPRLPLFYNDAELWARVRSAGRTVEVVPDATAEHGAGTSIRRADGVLMRAEWVAATRTYLRQRVGPAGRAVLFAILLADAVASWLLARVGLAPREAFVSAVGTLGGLGLPGGPPPPLTPVRRLVHRGRAGNRRSP